MRSLWYTFVYLSIAKGILLETFSERLKEERERLGLSQTALGKLCGVQKLSQINYEKGVRYPDSRYLNAISNIGADVLYILTGKHELKSTNFDDKERLQIAIEAVEEGLEIIQKKLPSDKKAELIMAAYDLISEPGNAGEKVIKLIRLVA